MKELVPGGAVTQSIKPAAITASADGASVDLQGYDGAEVVVNSGTVTDGTHAITLEESDDDSTFTDVAAADIVGDEPTLITTTDDQSYMFGYSGGKRYIRAITTVTSTSSGGIYGVSIIRGRPTYA